MSFSSSPPRSINCQRFSLNEIEDATKNFDELSVLGQGGEAKVYLAQIILARSEISIQVAVKHLKPNSSGFEDEIQIMSKIQHPNILSLLGYCNDSGQKILIYEYMDNRSLADYVQKKPTSTVSLSWQQRLKICLGAAIGLNHLHAETKEFPKGIIHRDVKPDNILLDANWVAKISDFGMFKLSRADQIDSAMPTMLKGTGGYYAPEYIKYQHVTRKIDVYAFGVVLFQVLCRKMPWDRGDESYYGMEDEDLGQWARQNVDSEIRGEISDYCLKAYTEIIRKSLSVNPNKRPAMDEVVLNLQNVLKYCQEPESSKATLTSNEPTVLAADVREADGSRLWESRYLLPPGHLDIDPQTFAESQEIEGPHIEEQQNENTINSNHADAPKIPDSEAAGQKSKEYFVNSPYLPPILEELSSSIPEPDGDEDVNGYDTLPAIEGLQILGEAFPGRELQACGYSTNGTTYCWFKWVRHLEDGSISYIDGAKQPTYVVTADDVDTYLAVEVQPMDDDQRKGELIKCFANSNRKISCYPEVRQKIERTLNTGHTSYKLSLWVGSQDTWEPATLKIKTDGYTIKTGGFNGVVVTEKFSPATVVKISCEIPIKFSIVGSGGVEWYLRTEHSSTGISCSRDTIVLTLRLFIKRAVEKTKGKKKRVLFFTR